MTDRFAPPPALAASPGTGDADEIPFTPVPAARVRRDGWTPARQRAFINALAQIGVVRAAAASVGMSTKSAYDLRKRPGAESFAEAWDVVAEMGLDNAADTAIARAIHGELVPVFRRGVKIGERRRYNNRLLMAALRLADPRYRVTGTRSPLPPPSPDLARDRKRT